MADVNIIPKIRCDNCGTVTFKDVRGSHTSRSFHKPREWGSARLESGRGMSGYPSEELKFIDLCPACATAAHDAAAEALKIRRGETNG